MPRDTQIVRSAPSAAPKDYSIDQNVELILRSVHAEFTDNGAATDWLPCVDLISDSGHTIVRCADPNVKVTAGDDAEVTWFPDVKPSGASTAGAVTSAWFFGSRVTNQSIAAGNFNRIGWTHHVTSDATVFSVTTGLTANDTVHGLKAGVYIAMGDLNWTSPQTYPHYCQIVSDFFAISGAATSPDSDSATDTTEANNQRHVHDSAILLTQAVPGEISLFAGNGDAVAHNVTLATYAILYLSNSTLVT